MGVSFLSATLPSTILPLLMDGSLKNSFPSTKLPIPVDRTTFAQPICGCFRLVANGRMDFYQRLIEIHSYLSNFGAVNQEIYGKRTFYTEFTAS